MDPYLIVFLALVGSVVLVAGSRISARERRARAQYTNMVRAGATEPVSLHPALDPNRCISIGACATACPEGEVIGIVDGRPELINPQKCIGHSACAAACPVDAITLVFGSATRGVDIPHVMPSFETNAENIFIAGELGGMGLIRNAVTQGRQAMDSIAEKRSDDPSISDVFIVGAGPAGIAATLQAEARGLRYIVVDQYDIGGTVLSYPRQKLVMTQPMDIPIYGKYTQREATKEELLELWKGIVARTGVSINTHERLASIERSNGHFEITTTKDTYLARNVLLAIGRRGTPRKLGVPGEDSAKVTYKLIEPEQYRGNNHLVVGGGDSAIEAALALSSQPDTQVTLSYRKRSFSRAKVDNVTRITKAIDSGHVEILWESAVKTIGEKSVAIEIDGDSREIANNYVFVFAGGELPTAFLRSLGIDVETKFGQK